MNQANALEQLTGLCTEPLASDPRPRAALARAGITESFVFESFRLGYCADQVAEHLARDQELAQSWSVAAPSRTGASCCRAA